MNRSARRRLARFGTIGLTLVAGIAIGAAATARTAQPEGDWGEMSPEDRAWMEAGMPGEKHRKLDSMAGDWSSTSWWQMDPESERIPGSGDANHEWIFDGRFMAMHFEGNMAGMDLEGHGVVGYDNIRQQYFSIWLDSMSTGAYVDYGQMREDGVLEFHGEMTDPLTKDKFKTISTTDLRDPDKIIMDFWFLDDKGEKFHSGHMEFTRD